MVIQRIQSLFLLLAAVLMTLLSLVVPIADNVMLDVAPKAFYVYDLPALLVICLITAILLVVDIFLYGNLPLQMKVARICIVMTVVSAAFIGYVWATAGGIYPKYVMPAIMLVATLLLSFAALKGMNKDYKRLRSYDRLR